MEHPQQKKVNYGTIYFENPRVYFHFPTKIVLNMVMLIIRNETYNILCVGLMIKLTGTMRANSSSNHKMEEVRGPINQIKDVITGFGSASVQIGGKYPISFKGFQNSSSIPKRASFPSDFIFGVGSSAMQIEGAAHEGGRGLGVWDDNVERHKATFVDGDKFSTQIEHYKRYKEDVQHLKHLGVDSYRMSISWSRVMPGRFFLFLSKVI